MAGNQVVAGLLSASACAFDQCSTRSAGGVDALEEEERKGMMRSRYFARDGGEREEVWSFARRGVKLGIEVCRTVEREKEES